MKKGFIILLSTAAVITAVVLLRRYINKPQLRSFQRYPEVKGVVSANGVELTVTPPLAVMLKNGYSAEIIPENNISKNYIFVLKKNGSIISQM